MILIFTIWVENNGFFWPFVLKDIPDFDGLVPGTTGQQGLTRTETQTADGGLMTCQNLKENIFKISAIEQQQQPRKLI